MTEQKPINESRGSHIPPSNALPPPPLPSFDEPSPAIPAPPTDSEAPATPTDSTPPD